MEEGYIYVSGVGNVALRIPKYIPHNPPSTIILRAEFKVYPNTVVLPAILPPPPPLYYVAFGFCNILFLYRVFCLLFISSNIAMKCLLCLGMVFYILDMHIGSLWGLTFFI